MKNEDLFQSISKLTLFCENQFNLINQRLTTIEERVTNLQSYSHQSSSHQVIENKVEFLNENIPHINDDIINYINENIIIEHEHIFSIMSQEKNIYDTVILILCNLNNSDTKKCLYTLKEKYKTFYYWNNKKITWEKITETQYKIIFECVQQKITEIFNQLIKTKHKKLKNIDIIEKSELFFVDKFDHKNFKKKMFDVFNDI